MEKIENFRADVEKSGITVRQGVLKVTGTLSLRAMAEEVELFNEQLSKQAAESNGKKMKEEGPGNMSVSHKVWVAERALKSEN